MSLGSRLATYLALALLVLALGPSTGSVGPGHGNPQPRPVRLAIMNTLSYTGIDPDTLSLNWTTSTDPNFVEYDLQRFSNILNGWETVAALTPRTNTTFFVTGLAPSASNSWRMMYQDSGSSYLSNTLLTTQPSASSFSYSMFTDTSMTLDWTNNAVYEGPLHFASYQIIASINGAKNFTFTTINNVNTLSFTSGLSPSSTYALYLNTTDKCLGEGCPTTSAFASSLSNKVTVNTPGSLSASLFSSQSSVDVGQPVSLTCFANGGSAPYTYSWNVGDGTTGLTGAHLTHIFTGSGSTPVECTVSDRLGTTVTAGPIWVQVITELSIGDFTVTPTSIDLGLRVTFAVDPIGGNGSLTYSYEGLPPGCTSLNAESFVCTPKTTGYYEITVTVTDQGHESSISTTHLSVNPSQVLGQPQEMGLAVLYGAASTLVALAAIVTALVLRRRSARPDLPP